MRAWFHNPDECLFEHASGAAATLTPGVAGGQPEWLLLIPDCADLDEDDARALLSEAKAEHAAFRRGLH